MVGGMNGTPLGGSPIKKGRLSPSPGASTERSSVIDNLMNMESRVNQVRDSHLETYRNPLFSGDVCPLPFFRHRERVFSAGVGGSGIGVHSATAPLHC